MFTRVFALLPLALLASANHLAARDNTGGGNCDTGSQFCCNQSFSLTQSVPDNGLFGDVFELITALATDLGVDCSIPLSSCTLAPVCCDNVHQDGLINIGCSPIIL